MYRGGSVAFGFEVVSRIPFSQGINFSVQRMWSCAIFLGERFFLIRPNAIKSRKRVVSKRFQLVFNINCVVEEDCI
jgi:hypothetical protein